MQQQQNQYKEPLILLQKYHQYLQSKPHQLTQILVHERMVYLMATALQNNETLPKGLDFLNELTLFINKVNIKVMTSSESTFDDKLNLISKCVDLLFFKPIKSSIKPGQKLLQLRALTFNNLSCIYKQHNQLNDALSALQTSLEIQQTLLNKNFQDTYKSIASTYINKCVILSSLSLHQEAIQTIKTSLDNIQKYKQKFGQAIKEKELAEITHMTMLAYFNIAVQYQHLKMADMAIKFYEMAYKIAKENGNWGVKNQCLSALKNLKAKK